MSYEFGSSSGSDDCRSHEVEWGQGFGHDEADSGAGSSIAGDTQAFDELIVDGYKQHNPLAGDGLQAVKSFFTQFGPVDVDVHRVIAEGDLVAVHSHYKTLNSAGVDIFRFNGDGKIIEHWDVLQEVPPAQRAGTTCSRN